MNTIEDQVSLPSSHISMPHSSFSAVPLLSISHLSRVDHLLLSLLGACTAWRCIQYFSSWIQRGMHQACWPREQLTPHEPQMLGLSKSSHSCHILTSIPTGLDM